MVLEVCGWTSLTRCSEIPEFRLVAGSSGAMESLKVMKEVVNTLICMRLCSTFGGVLRSAAQRAADGKSHCSRGSRKLTFSSVNE